MESFIDIHPHIISDDDKKYPRNPLFGVQSDWSRDRPVSIERLIAAMDTAGISKAAVVQASTCYGYDNSYLVDSIARYPDRLTGVGSVDMVQTNALERVRYWIERGITGLRLFTGGSTAAFNSSLLDNPRSFPVWEFCGENRMSMCLQTNPSALTQVAGLAKRFPNVPIIIDHLGRPDVTDGPPYRNAASLFGLAPLKNIYLKLTPRIFADARLGLATPETLFPRLVDEFGTDRLVWGSNYPASEGNLATNLEMAKSTLQMLSDEDRGWIFSKTAQRLYPKLAD